MIMTEYDVKILRELNGEPQEGLAWGAAMGVCIEDLYGSGYVAREMRDGTLTYFLSDKGKAYLDGLEA